MSISYTESAAGPGVLEGSSGDFRVVLREKSVVRASRFFYDVFLDGADHADGNCASRAAAEAAGRAEVSACALRLRRSAGARLLIRR